MAFRHRDIVATTFWSAETGKRAAYGALIDDEVLGVALPARFKGRRPRVRLFLRGRKPLVVPVVDVGPWNTRDPYWLTNSRPQAETGRDLFGRRTNRAGIDLTPATARALGLPRQWKGVVDFELVW